jgi:hypothetical protein
MHNEQSSQCFDHLPATSTGTCLATSTGTGGEAVAVPMNSVQAANMHLVPANKARPMNPQPLLKIKIKKRNQRHNSKVLKDYDCKDLKMRKFLVLN